MRRGPKKPHRVSSVDVCGWKTQENIGDGASRDDDQGARAERRGFNIAGRRSRNEHRTSSIEGRIPAAL
eukprot:2043220-Pyramimonas_sp.AAC.1